MWLHLGLLWIELCVPLKSIFWSPTPSMTIFGDRTYLGIRLNEVIKVNPLQYDWLAALKGETSLVDQWLRPWISTAGGLGLILGWGTRILYALQHGQKIKQQQQQTKRREEDIGTLSPRKDQVMRVGIQPSAGQVKRSYQNPTLPASWSWTSSLQDYEKINPCCLCYPVWGILYGSPLLPHPLPWTIQEIWRCLA